MGKLGVIAAVVLGGLTMGGCTIASTWMGTYNGIQKRDEGVKGKEREIASCYQKRGDMITNLANTVERFAQQERSVIVDATQARGPNAGSGAIKLPEGATPEQITAVLAAQASTMVRLNSVTEAYPQLKSDQNFLRMQADLKQVETQCDMIRRQYITSVQQFNTGIRTFPSNIIAGFHGVAIKEQIKFDNEAQNRISPRVFEPAKK